MEQIKREALHDEEVKKILDKMQEDYQVDKVKDLIQDNKIEFEFGEKQYRVRLLNAKEKDELDLIRRSRFGQLLQDKNILLEAKLITAYQEKGINISELDAKIKNLNSQINDLNYKLGEALVKTPGDIILNTYKQDILKLTYQLHEVTIQRGHLLEYSLENHLQNYVAQAISYLSLDVKTDDKWARAFDKLENFMEQDEKLINLTAMYSMYLHYR